jgi:2,5-dihydroxypyridine 5,6-dioxygenase
MLNRWLASWKDEQSYGVSHIGWGTNDSAVWLDSNYFCFADAESYYGVMQIALGSNIFDTPLPNYGLGGKNTAVSHTDIECLNTDFYLDEEIIVKDGDIVHPECK